MKSKVIIEIVAAVAVLGGGYTVTRMDFIGTGKVGIVYNYKDGEYKKVGKVRATKAGKIRLDRFSLFETTNKYKLELSKNLTKKLKGKMITVNKNGTTIKMLVNGNEKEKYIVEVRI